MRAALLTLLRADATLAALLPGGVFDARDVGEIGHRSTPAAFDANREIRGCALVRIGDAAPSPATRRALRLLPTIYVYAPPTAAGRAAVDTARLRLRELLDRVRVADAGTRAWEVRHAGDTSDVEDDLLRAALAICRYSAVAEPALVPAPPPPPPPPPEPEPEPEEEETP